MIWRSFILFVSFVLNAIEFLYLMLRKCFNWQRCVICVTIVSLPPALFVNFGICFSFNLIWCQNFLVLSSFVLFLSQTTISFAVILLLSVLQYEISFCGRVVLPCYLLYAYVVCERNSSLIAVATQAFVYLSNSCIHLFIFTAVLVTLNASYY